MAPPTFAQVSITETFPKAYEGRTSGRIIDHLAGQADAKITLLEGAAVIKRRGSDTR
jgi:hypothetical protein